MDLIIIGTGLSSLLLARSLINGGFTGGLRLIGPAGPLPAHRLSFWADGPTPFDSHVDADYSHLRLVDAHGEQTQVELGDFTWRTFRAREWAHVTLTELLAAPNVEHIEAEVDESTGTGRRATAECGSVCFDADFVFDGVHDPPVPPSWWQRYEGWEVVFEGKGLDTATATLADFRIATDRDYRFISALPLEANRLYVQHVSARREAHEPALEAWLRVTLGKRRWRVVERDVGATPLWSERPGQPLGRVVPIGVAAGLANVRSGMAVMELWRDAERLAEGLLHEGRPPKRPRPGLVFRAADRAFLERLEHAPGALPTMLRSLFAKAPGDVALRFLEDHASAWEQLVVARAVPRWLASGLRSAPRRTDRELMTILR